MRICTYCEATKSVSTSCPKDTFDGYVDGKQRDRIAYGSHERDQRAHWGKPCRVCGCAPFGIHHSDCWEERCAICQKKSCNCRVNPSISLEESCDNVIYGTFG